MRTDSSRPSWNETAVFTTTQGRPVLVGADAVSPPGQQARLCSGADRDFFPPAQVRKKATSGLALPVFALERRARAGNDTL